MKVNCSQVILIWSCPDCKKIYNQNLYEIVESGTAVCPECDCDCQLEEVEVKEK